MSIINYKQVVTVDAEVNLPTNVLEGTVAFAKDTDALYTFNGTTWDELASGGGGISEAEAIVISITYSIALG